MYFVVDCWWSVSSVPVIWREGRDQSHLLFSMCSLGNNRLMVETCSCAFLSGTPYYILTSTEIFVKQKRWEFLCSYHSSGNKVPQPSDCMNAARVHTNKICFLYSWFRASSFYINKIQQYATNAGFYYCKLTLHVSGVYWPHHQEYIKL